MRKTITYATYAAVVGLFASGLLAAMAAGQTVERRGDAFVIRDTTRPLTFRWPDPAAVMVTEKAVKKGRTVKQRYTVTVRREGRGRNLAVRCGDYRILEVDGVDVSRAPTPAFAAMSAIPDIEVTPEGRFVRFLDFEKTVKRVLGALEARKLDRKRMQQIRRFLRSPDVRTVMQENVKEFWRAWVEAWAGRRLQAGQKEQYPRVISLPGGDRLTVPCTVRNHGPLANRPDHVRLTMQFVVEGDSARKAMVRTLQRLSRNAPNPPKVEITDDVLAEFKMTARVETITRPDTLQPQSVTTEKVVTLRIRGAKEKKEIEKREYTFNWEGPENLR